MKKTIITALIMIMILMMPAGVCHAFSGYMYDYANVLDGEQKQDIPYHPDYASFNVFIFTDKEDYHYDYSDLEQRRIGHVSLFIKVDESGDYVTSAVTAYHDPWYGWIPSDQTLVDYHNSIVPLLKNGHYKDGIYKFFSKVNLDISEATTEKDAKKEDERQNELELEEKQARQAVYYPLYIGIAISAPIAVIVAASDIRRTLKKLKTVKYSGKATSYIDKERIAIHSEKEDRGIWELLI